MQVQLYTPYDKQLEVHAALDDENHLIDTVVASRQTGKTMLAQNQCIKWGIEKEKAVIMWVSPTYGQAIKVYKSILSSIQDAPFFHNSRATQGDAEISFTNGTVIKFKSGQAEDNLRGETVNYMVIDEAAFIKEDTFLEILLPMLNVAGRKLLIISTPKGRSNWLHKYFLRGVNGSTGYRSFRFNCYTNPYANPEIIRIAKESMPDLIFQQEYLAEFVEGAAIIENITELCNRRMIFLPEQGVKYYAGIDLALKNDYTVFTVVDQDGNMVYFDRFNKVSASELKERLAKEINKWKPENTLIETNNMGGVIYDDLRDLYNLTKIEGFNTSATSKNEIINQMLNLFSSKKITLPNDPILKGELETFEMKVNPSGKVSFAGAQGMHDDMVMSLAIALEAQRRGSRHMFNLRIVK